MAKHKKNNDSNFHIVYIFLILIFVAGITFLTLSMFVPKKQSENTQNTTVNETEQKAKKEESQNNNSETNNQTPKQNEDEPEADEKSLNASITMNEVSDGKYRLRVTVYELLESGNCSLHMESSRGDTVDRTAKIINAGASSSSCEGFDISTSGISSGSYNFSVKITSGERTKTLTGVIQI